MPFTLVAFQEAEPTGTVYENIDGVDDQHVRVEGDVIYMSDFNEIIGVAFGGCTELYHGYLASPSLRRLANYYMNPVDLTDGTTIAAGCLLHPLSPLPVEANEGLEAFAIASATVAPAVTTVGVFLSDGPVSPVDGEIFHVRASATVAALVAGEWSNRNFEFADTLPVGRYQIVGARVMIPNGLLFRFVPIGEAYRPGGCCTLAKNTPDPDLHRNGGLGVWCEFDQITPPSIDILSDITAVGTALEMYIDLIKVG